MTVQEHTVSRAPSAAAKSVELYDFRRPTTLAREHSRVLELAFETFARQWGTQLTAKVRLVSQVTCEQVTMVTYDEYAAGLPAHTAMVLCELADTEPKAVIQFPTTAALSWVTHMLGGNGAAHDLPERKFTPLEQVLVRRLIDDALEDLRYSLGPLLVTGIGVSGIQYNSQFAQAAATRDLMIVASFTIRMGDEIAPATLAMPSEVLLPQLGAASPTKSAANVRELLHDQLAQVPVEVALQVTPAMVRPSTILSLAAGDLIPLPHPAHRPFALIVDGVQLARAAVGSNGSRLACVVVNTEENPS
ncbi:flagellar motor switch protein FliM [Microbacterium sp. STN6]|uniref:flagellar motor switch protein FliM n=1 Tax=Microbacterium sp. STN6 TaxID=2995588 RepID=UPI002260BFF7|nr:flagellar motor switch protein FliM [Microbacterium sp. STN6]MCX7522391.1 flagellar motor switch protein FliM [Microbacterium sp. STN6]